MLAESLANLACVGARAVAVVNCLNFGNPEHPEVMWQLSEAVDGLADACRAFGLPVIGGNVSLYNESAGRDIDPTVVLGVLGLVDRLRRRPPGPGWADGSTVVLLGSRSAADGPRHPLAGSRWAVECRGRRRGTLPPLDTGAHRRLVDLVAGLVAEALDGGAGLFTGVHDVSAGGLGVALAEMAVRSADGAGRRVGGRRATASSSASSPRGWWRPPTVPMSWWTRAAAAGVAVLGARTGRRRPAGRAGAGRPRRWTRCKRPRRAPCPAPWARHGAQSAGRARAAQAGRRAASSSRTSSGTRRSPWPVPTERSAFTVPW